MQPKLPPDEQVDVELAPLLTQLMEWFADVPAERPFTRAEAMQFCRAAYAKGYDTALKAPLPEETP